jgi:hypothetical protein
MNWKHCSIEDRDEYENLKKEFAAFEYSIPQMTALQELDVTVLVVERLSNTGFNEIFMASDSYQVLLKIFPVLLKIVVREISNQELKQGFSRSDFNFLFGSKQRFDGFNME